MIAETQLHIVTVEAIFAHRRRRSYYKRTKRISRSTLVSVPHRVIECSLACERQYELPRMITMSIASIRLKLLSGFIAAIIILTMTGALRANAQIRSMSESDIRKELIGSPMKGFYVDGRPWDETYFSDGRIRYRDLENNWQGKWSFRGSGFCTFYNDRANGGCWQVLKVSQNCYEFYAMSRAGVPLKKPFGQSPIWVARGWRVSHASTCDPQVGV